MAYAAVDGEQLTAEDLVELRGFLDRARRVTAECRAGDLE